MSRLVSLMLVSGVAFLAVACEQSGEQPLPFAPEFAKGGGKGGGKPGGGDNVMVEFLDPGTLFPGVQSDYLLGPQSMNGNNSKRKLFVEGDAVSVTLLYTEADIDKCDLEDLGFRERFAQVPETSMGALYINVRKNLLEDGVSYDGVVVNFTTIGLDGGSEYLLTTGGGDNLLDETTDPDWTRVAKTGGYVRIKRDGEPKGAICHGIVDFEFVVSR